MKGPVILERHRPEADRRTPQDTGRNRLMVTATVFGAAFLIIAARLIDVSLLHGPVNPANADGPVRDSRGAVAARAEITDRNGIILATSLPASSLYADSRLVPDPADAAARLARVLPGAKTAELRRRLSSGRSFVWLRRHLTPEQKYRVNRLGIPGLDFREEARRVYPNGHAAAHVLGFTDIDNRGISGIEGSLNGRLGKGGRAVALSLDIRVQHLLQAELTRAMDKHRAVGAAGVVADVNTGEILGMVSLPDFDPNRPPVRRRDRLFNRATMGVYEMGSTFKIFTTAMALDAGAVRLHDGYDATSPIRVARFTIRDYHAKKRWLSVPEIFMYSSNIGAAKMALDMGPLRQRKFLAGLGLLRRSPVELPEAGAPLYPEKWGALSTMTIGFGHGMAVSPLHVVSGVSAIINGGVLVPPTLLRRDGPPPRGAVTRIIKEPTSAVMRRLLRLVVAHGTGKRAAAQGYLVGGKTGTAEKPGRKRYRRGALMSSFVGAFPMDAPRFVVLAVLDEPQATKDTYGYATGGWVAAPVVGAVIRRLAALHGMTPVQGGAPELLRGLQTYLPDQGGGERHFASY